MKRANDRLDLKVLLDTPPWDWPGNAGAMFHRILTDSEASGQDRLIAAELAGDFVVINHELCDALMNILSNAAQPEPLRARAAMSLGPILEHADTFGFEDPDDVSITEQTFERIRLLLRQIYFEESVPKEVQRHALESSVRSPQEWHRDAIAHACDTGDREWMLTAVFAMRFVPGFDDRILEALKTSDPEILREAVIAAGDMEVRGASSRVLDLAEDETTPKPLRIAAIGAVANLVPDEALELLDDLTDSEDEDIADAATGALDLIHAEESAGWDDGDDAFDFDDDGDDEEDDDEAGRLIH